MLAEPKVEHWQEKPYAAIRTRVAMMAVPKDLPPLIFEVLNWVKKNNLGQTGPPFFRYLRMDNGVLDVEVGIPLSKLPTGDGRIIAGSFPEGKYLTARHTGPYTTLPQSHQAVEKYARENGLKPGTIKDADGQVWGTRAEFYVSDPMVEKDPSKWITDIALLLEG
jgi:Transcriptional regulator, effector-binding domain/component